MKPPDDAPSDDLRAKIITEQNRRLFGLLTMLLAGPIGVMLDMAWTDEAIHKYVQGVIGEIRRQARHFRAGADAGAPPPPQEEKPQ